MAGKSSSGSRTFFSTLNEAIYEYKRRFIDTIAQGSLSLLPTNMFATPALKWCPTSEEELETVETELLSGKCLSAKCIDAILTQFINIYICI